MIHKNIDDYLNSNKLNEASFTTFNVDNILTDKFIKNFIKTDDVSDNLLDYFIEENDLTNEDSDEIRISSQFFDFVHEELERHLDDAMTNIYDKIDRFDKITIYRAITVDNNWLEHLEKQGKHLGIYWSWDSTGAETHWGDPAKKAIAIIETEIDEKVINWKETLEMNLHPNFSEEKEIRLFKGTPFQIKRLTINDEEIDISIIKDKVFYT